MIHTIRKSKITKVVASYLAIQLIVQMIQPMQLWALTGGPKQPEFNSFTPIGTSDMVDLTSGDFNYNIPIMDVGGYPLNLAYDSGVTMDQEASWVGLGWNLNVGQINRQVRGIPDDFKGDLMETENNIRDNVTVGVDAKVDAQVFGIELPDQVGVNFGVNLRYNNYTGISFSPSLGLSFSLSKNSQVGMNLGISGSATDGATVSPGISLKGKLGKKGLNDINGILNAGISYNSARGLSSFNLSASIKEDKQHRFLRKMKIDETNVGQSFTNGSGSISFANTTFTPRKRTAYTEFTGTLGLSLGADVWGLDGEAEVSASASVQKIKDELKEDKAYGYEYTGYATNSDLLDYNRENDDIISRNTLVLPTTNYTYDTYVVQAQGSNGMFRPFRWQVGQVNDEYVKDHSDSFSTGVEIEAGLGFHMGFNFTAAPTKSYTGIWNTNATGYFKQAKEEIKSKNEEPVYFKYIGEKRIDKDNDLFLNRLGGYNAIALDISGKGFGKQAANQFVKKSYRTEVGTNGEPVHTPYYEKLGNFTTKFERTKRVIRNQSVQKISRGELGDFYNDDYMKPWLARNTDGEDHHTAEIRVLQGDGSHYVFGEPAYNKEKHEVTFATGNYGNCATGEVLYRVNENTSSNSSGRDHFYNKVKTPAYVHTYLLSSVLSSDYEDLTGDGPTDDDLGAYTRFEYQQFESEYNWRVPYKANSASFNEGLNTDRGDQKGNYIFGKKEIKYIKKIVTKTHVALFELSKRKDGRGVAGENGGNPSSNTNYMYKLDKVSLYSKPEAIAANILDDNGGNDKPIEAIKTAHFVYNYSQCKNVENNLGGTPSVNEISNEGGKLTLKKVYFTYRDSKMGKYTPYEFHYDGFNPDYHLKSYDVWGNYKPIVANAISVTTNSDGTISVTENTLGSANYCNTKDQITAPEFAFVQQENRELQDEFTSAWSLTSIDLPSGGKIDLEYESDDYQYVQDKAAMQMFTVMGAGVDATPSTNNKLYIPGQFGNDAKYLYVKVPKLGISSPQAFKAKYLKGQEGKPIYFRFLMNMTKKGARDINSNDFDYVTGYFELGNEDISITQADDNDIIASIPMKFWELEGGTGGGNLINPINKAGLYFARNYLNAQSLGINADYRTENIKTIAKNILSSFASIKDIFSGPNKKLRGYGYMCANQFKPEKSWIRLTTPRNYKLGGGVRIKKLTMHDQWDQMVSEAGNKNYQMMYGQTYDYTLSDGGSSGVATFEPNGSKENPFVEPFYNKGERLIAPKEVSYVEKPFGASFFPAPTVTYSKVTVSNLKREGITKHATGRVTTEHYTSKDFPTKVDYTNIDGPGNYATNQNQVLQNLIKSLVGIPIRSKNEITLSQGFVVHTNDMNGKMKKQSVYAEGADQPLSSVENIYSTVEGLPNVLDNNVPVIDREGNIMINQTIAEDYDVVTDFRESYSKADTKGIKTNVVVIPTPLPPFFTVIPTAFYTDISIKNIAHSAITTKVIHTTAIMKEKIATDLGATVRTSNEAWDAETGQVILTKTVNEYNDQYYNFNFPAYWSYEQMGHASINLGITGTLRHISQGFYRYTDGRASDYFTLGDEITGSYGDESQRLWVVGFNNDGTGLLLMNRFGQVVNRSASDTNNVLEISGDIQFKIIRSGYRNQQGVNMASITMMKNPIKNEAGSFITQINTDTFNQDQGTSNAQSHRIVNASAVGYSDFWNCQCERGLPSLPFVTPTSSDLADLPIEDYKFNPYLFNAHGEWRAEKSYAYLTERTEVTQGTSNKVNNRKEGYFKEFTPYYALINGKWDVNPDNTHNKWTFASEVTQYSPYGAEVENKDALQRYSSAQYGYNMTLPTAVASNSRYRYMGADNFEDYNYSSSIDLEYFDYVKGEGIPEEHFNFKKAANDDGSDTGVMVSDEFSHTGMTSLLIPKNDDAVLRRPLKGELPKNLDHDEDGWADIEDNCPYTRNYSQSDYDEDGIGDICDDDAVPTITSIDTWPQETYRIKKSFFTIEGKPNDVVRYKTYVSKGLRHGQKLFVNDIQVDDGAIGSVTLDVTGKARIKFDVHANNPRRRKHRGRTLGHFVILHKNSNLPVSGVEIRLCPRAGKKKDSYNGDRGDASWRCDTRG